MQVEISHHIDASEPDEEGNYLYYYEYDIYVFSKDDAVFFVRAYTDEPDCASFQSRSEGSNDYLLKDADLHHPLLLLACEYLRKSGKTRLQWLSGKDSAYLPILTPEKEN
ncbi:hypothetical protein [Phyllobacterium sp. YR531]|uniref:hypothetical protein n=1 Tax=Phyllobacterium sp. YR531 TaxID=1144343 RepID=UPI00026F9924|nr:hypothetical protein [Phyllobacterium sp. YR531]EJM99256.1 hypothetical protein PMI41_04156 [Phyllobacterium sp. YR531]